MKTDSIRYSKDYIHTMCYKNDDGHKFYFRPASDQAHSFMDGIFYVQECRAEVDEAFKEYDNCNYDPEGYMRTLWIRALQKYEDAIEDFYTGFKKGSAND